MSRKRNKNTNLATLNDLLKFNNGDSMSSTNRQCDTGFRFQIIEIVQSIIDS